MAFGEKKLGGVESRLLEIRQVVEGLEKSIQGIASREQLVNAVKAEVEQVHQISAQSKADLLYVTDNRTEIAMLKTSVNELLSRIAETDERIVSIDARRKLVDEVQAKANAIVHLLDEMLNLLDHVLERSLEPVPRGHFLIERFHDGKQIAVESDDGAARGLDGPHD